MREIKYRVWDEDRQKMYYQLENSPSFGTGEDDKAVSIEDVFFYEKDSFVKMQYTGLKDKNGTEICEGDLIRKKFKDREIGEFYAVGEVVFGTWFAGFIISYQYHGYNKLERVSSDMDKDGWIVSNRDMEIVGNIYEKPEKLKEEK